MLGVDIKECHATLSLIWPMLKCSVYIWKNLQLVTVPSLSLLFWSMRWKIKRAFSSVCRWPCLSSSKAWLIDWPFISQEFSVYCEASRLLENIWCPCVEAGLQKCFQSNPDSVNVIFSTFCFLTIYVLVLFLILGHLLWKMCDQCRLSPDECFELHVFLAQAYT